MTRDDLNRMQDLLTMPAGISVCNTHLYQQRRDELLALLWEHRVALLLAAQQAMDADRGPG